jgi:hypothetical protein
LELPDPKRCEPGKQADETAGMADERRAQRPESMYFCLAILFTVE